MKWLLPDDGEEEDREFGDEGPDAPNWGKEGGGRVGDEGRDGTDWAKDWEGELVKEESVPVYEDEEENDENRLWC